MRSAQAYQVKLFLFQFKEFAQNNFTFIEREKCLDSIARLGITIQQAKQEILELTYEDYEVVRYRIQGLRVGNIGNLARLYAGEKYS